MCFYFFFFNDTATTEIYTLSLHDALPISSVFACVVGNTPIPPRLVRCAISTAGQRYTPYPDHLSRSEEHTSELQSLAYLVCRLLLEKKKKKNKTNIIVSENQ